MEKEAALKIPLLELRRENYALSCLDRTGFCVVNVKEFDPIALTPGEKVLLQDRSSGKKYMAELVAYQLVDGGGRYYIVRSCSDPIPPDSAIQDCGERLCEDAVAKGLTGSPFYR